ncbi:TIR domain protein [Luteitalea pratensis]|uniref:TIR domain protein n=1 Tax=Luteitalea pratensis TaxID=1855912 RepID=A0A143PIZ8_LUTPR|nr:TIR domain protein [Luteitalea pratensis]
MVHPPDDNVRTVADIFLSYAREDIARVRLIVAALESHGWTVFWDRHIPHGQDFNAYLQARLDEAKCVIVAWSKASIASQFVRDEAGEGKLRLVPLLLADVRPPLGFRQLQTANLTDWSGDASHEEFSRFVESVRAIVGASTPPKASRRVDAYVSYVSLDNVPESAGRNGWVTNFVRALETRGRQRLGREFKVYWYPWLEGKAPFPEGLLKQLHDVMAFVPIVSNHYVESKWAARELAEFCDAAQSQGGTRVRDRSRIFKVLKSPVPTASQPRELQSLLGYEFFTLDPESGKVQEFDKPFGPDAQQQYWLKLDDLARDLVNLLGILESEAPSGKP